MDQVQYQRAYEQLVKPYLKNGIEILLTPSQLQEINCVASNMGRAKLREVHHLKDAQAEQKRWATGLSGEMAVESYVGVPFVDLRIGDSQNFNCADLASVGVDLGIKTVEYGKFPVVHTRPLRPEVIVVKMEPQRLILMGVASLSLLRDPTACSAEYKIHPGLAANPHKTCFIAFDRLCPIGHPMDILLHFDPERIRHEHLLQNQG